jgi:NAD(P)-dependent dehydrogenase (short-subunit alcohol dehydrogenase family)
MTQEPRILVTGGGSGLGLAVAVRLGGRAVLLGRRPEILAQAAERTGAKAVVGDVTGDPSEILRRTGPLCGIVHAAGHLEPGSLDHWTQASFERLFAVHVIGPALLTRAWASTVTGSGSVVFLGSTLAVRSAPGRGAYAAAKAAQASLGRSLALELAPQGIRVNSVLCGVVPTAMTADQDLQALARLHPLGLGTPEHVAAAIVDLLANPWMTGAQIAVDGGLLAT